MLKTVFGKKEDTLQQAFAEFSKSLTLIVDLEQLKDNVIARIRETIHTRSVALFLLNPDLNRFELAEMRGTNSLPQGRPAFYPNEPLMRWFTINETFLEPGRQEAIVSYFNPRERELLDALEAAVVFPLLVMNHVAGLVCLGPRDDGQPYTGADIDMLGTFLGQAAFAFENAYLYQQQKNRLRKMYRADRLATLGQLAAGAAHEIRNPLTSIRSTIQYLRKDMGAGPRHDLMTELIDEVDRINTIIEGLLSFSKPGTPQVEKTDLGQLIDQTISLIGTTAEKSRITIHRARDEGQYVLDADPAQLKQVFLNIMMNGIQAMPDGGDLSIAMNLRHADGAAPEHSRAYVVTVEDTGPGIPPDDLEHIFDPFFTTKKDGTGLGLSITYGIIRQHGGDIEITSTTGDGGGVHGTTVTITLPAVIRRYEAEAAHDGEHSDR